MQLNSVTEADFSRRESTTMNLSTNYHFNKFEITIISDQSVTKNKYTHKRNIQ